VIRSLRLRVPVYASALLLLVGLALAAHATQPVTRSQMESFVYVVAAGSGSAILAAFWLLLTFVTSRVERTLEKHVGRLESMVSGFAECMRDHHEDPMAHPRGSAVRLDPMNAKLDALGNAVASVHEQTSILVTGQTAAIAELDEQDLRLAALEKGLHTLLAEHHILHGRALQHRAGDPPTIDLDKLREP
jgi:hypothetical protein